MARRPLFESIVYLPLIFARWSSTEPDTIAIPHGDEHETGASQRLALQ
jgi:hypothetical protein